MTNLREYISSVLHRVKGRLHRCQQGACFAAAYPCYLSESETPDYWYCWEHMFRQGFCRFCGLFWGGIEEFDFGSGYCPNCQDELDDEAYVVYGEDAP